MDVEGSTLARDEYTFRFGQVYPAQAILELPEPGLLLTMEQTCAVAAISGMQLREWGKRDGLIPVIYRPDSGKSGDEPRRRERVYDLSSVAAVRAIQLGKEHGFTLSASIDRHSEALLTEEEVVERLLALATPLYRWQVMEIAGLTLAKYDYWMDRGEVPWVPTQKGHKQRQLWPRSLGHLMLLRQAIEEIGVKPDVAFRAVRSALETEPSLIRFVEGSLEEEIKLAHAAMLEGEHRAEKTYQRGDEAGTSRLMRMAVEQRDRFVALRRRHEDDLPQLFAELDAAVPVN